MNSSWLLLVPALAAPSLASAQEPAPTPSNLEAGGLRPPDAVDPTQTDPDQNPEQTPEEQLEEADKEDAGRGLEWVWLNAEIGGLHVGLQTLSADDLVDPTQVKTTQTGLVYGAGLGLRLLVFTAGVRFRFASLPDFRLWTLGAEGGLRIPMGRLEPYFVVGAGYASIGSFSGTGRASEADVKGFNGRLGVGIDYYLSNTFSVGGNLSGDLLVLSRPRVPNPGAAAELSVPTVYDKDGSSIGAGATLTAVVGLHF